ncbi:DUF4296 domain-containing protein [Flavobacterium pallidum]|uniref:DUF4296 domain-containing protein n=1 Tax=Flavobacterium pallidum TaxID=2172098 RepID=A0A2S1SEJ3_9FLAO|nr:DUF4296 domain-containing protein [Flavobacterium pallidum]AWI24820.1 DUF4296 domain-containing protein [Flavobacterium pallidum]
MKNIVILLSALLLAGCSDKSAEKPDNLIPKDKMVDIIYDLSLLEAIRLSEPTSIAKRKINPSTYIYKKYKVDSLQFAKSDRYYANDIDGYAKMYEKVEKRLDQDKKIADSLWKIKSKIPQTDLKLSDQDVPLKSPPKRTKAGFKR